jgi:hypothetical protein
MATLSNWPCPWRRVRTVEFTSSNIATEPDGSPFTASAWKLHAKKQCDVRSNCWQISTSASQPCPIGSSVLTTKTEISSGSSTSRRQTNPRLQAHKHASTVS